MLLILAFIQSSGIDHCLMKIKKMDVSISARCSAHCLRILLGVLSRPEGLGGLMFVSLRQFLILACVESSDGAIILVNSDAIFLLVLPFFPYCRL